MLSEVTETQKDKLCKFFWGFELQIFGYEYIYPQVKQTMKGE